MVAAVFKELASMMSSTEMSYSLVVMTHDRLYALRDPYGNRPLCFGVFYSSAISNNDSMRKPLGYIAASESCAFPFGSEVIGEVKPGEIIEISRRGIRAVFQMKPAKAAFCIFEYVYFARADSKLEGQQVHSVREECGRILAQESPVEADVVCCVPDSAMAATIGYANEIGIKYEQILFRNSYVGRSFIQPNTELRRNSVVKKFGVISKNVEGKRIILIDDSIVRGNTMTFIVGMLRVQGAKEVHLRIASPPVKFPCFMGINLPSADELIASKLSIDEISAQFGADSVRYLSIGGLQKAVTKNIVPQLNFDVGHCMACLTGNYPVPLDW
ncbi:hypothetical protein AB6A40_000048 [Gnathostoma spinigerum]|uniref:Glutamine amidotransferase type-2 domain-containing protein n=1 Tax=Gnathostoma spinigerum TaxID=75299 RepID=A0ABD6E7I5_9BILA